MFYKYEIKKRGNERVLYIYMSNLLEESNEFRKKDNMTIENKIIEFIKKNNIDYNEGAVYIISNGIIIKSIDIHNRNVNIEELIGIDNYNNKNFIVKVEKNGILNMMNLEEFLISVLLSNNYIDINEEVLKALTILYRTYAYKQMNKKGYIEENNVFIEYKNLSYYKLLYFNNYEDIIIKFKKAINETDCIFMTYNNLFIDPYIHLVNNGHTDKLKNIDYLEQVNSLWDLISPYYLSKTNYNIKELENCFNKSKEDILNMKINKLTPNGSIESIKIGNNLYSGEDFRNKLNLPSLDMTIIINNKNVYFINRGNGNNLGLSIEGSKYLASIGCNYLQILNHYFPKCRIKKYSN